MAIAGNPQVWEGFWAQRGRGPESGCLLEALEAIDAVQNQVWQAFAAVLKPRARVLDLATGDGAVLGKMRAGRSDLRLTGVDSSRFLPAARPGTKLRAGVAIEQLPFADASFDAVVSQFGLEYSRTSLSTREAARVMRPGGRCRFVIHHEGSRILAHNLARLEALRWASGGSGPIGKARNLAKARALSALPTPPLFGEAVAEARRLFPDQNVAEEFTGAVKQTLDLGRRDVKGMLEALDELATRAANEIGRIESLAGAVRDRAGIERLAAELAAAGIVTEPPAELHEQGSGAPFAWLIDGSKA